MAAKTNRPDQADDQSTVLRDYLAWEDRGHDFQRRFSAVRLTIPEKLRRFLGELDTEAGTPTLVIPPMKRPFAAPLNWNESWIWIPAKEAEVKTVILAFLRTLGGAVPSRTVVHQVCEIAGTSEGTVANAGTQLHRDGLIERSSGAWSVIDTHGPILFESYVTGPSSAFGQYDLAAFRRMAIKHILRVVGPLQAAQIVQFLARCDWVAEPKDKDVVKLDLIALSNAESATRNSAKKWVLQEPEE